MSNLEQEYNKRFKDQERSTDGLDVDGLWGDIDKDLHEKNSNRFTKVKPIWLALTIVFLSASAAYFFKSSESNQRAHLTHSEEMTSEEMTINTVQSNNDETLSTSSQFLNSESSTVTPSKEASPTTSENTSNNASTYASSIGSNNNNNNNNNNKIADGNTISNDLPFSTNISKTEAGNVQKSLKKPPNQSIGTNLSADNSFNNRSDIATARNEDKSEETKRNDESQASDSNNSSSTQSTQAHTNTPNNPVPTDPVLINAETAQGLFMDAPTVLNNFFHSLTYDSFALPVLQIDKEGNYDPQAEDDGSTATWQIGAWAGANFLNFNYNSSSLPDLVALKNDTELGQWGSSFGLTASTVIKNRWLIGTGLEYHQLWTKFDYVQVETTPIDIQDQLLTIWIDATTGETLATETGTATVDRTETRTVLHYNQYQQFSIPLELGYQQATSQWLYGVSVGGVFNFTTSQIGKTLNANAEIAEFLEGDSIAPYKPFNIGLRIKPHLAYKISNQLSFNLSPQWTWQSGNDFDGTDLKLNIQQVNLNVGLVYSIGGANQ